MSATGVTTALHALRAALEVGMELKAPNLTAEIVAVEKQTGALRKWLGSGGVVTPTKDASRIALRDFVALRDLPTVRHATLASYGCAEPFDGWKHGIIADEGLFPEFLRRVDDWRDSPKALRLCYRGLLHAYFQYDVEKGAPSSARENWGRLRHYLGERSTFIRTTAFEPTWVAALNRNPELLGEDPGGFYGAEMFQGRTDRFDEVRQQLPVTETSWLVWRVIVGQIAAATGSSDEAFRAAIPRLIALLIENPAAKTFGLVRILNRYRNCASPVLHEQLRDFAVDTWGNPWLAMNEVAWSGVDEAARTMVADWLKLALMQKFFGLLAKDGMNDMRRLAFWQTYHRHIHSMYFALGDTAFEHPGPDYREVRKQMAGLQLRLTHNTDDNNAFIMCIGKHVIVEFGEIGNACFIFERDRLPFALSGNVAGNHLALKHPRHVERMSHNGAWEEKFKSVLANRVGVTPVQETQRYGMSAGSYVSPVRAPTSAPYPPPQQPRAYQPAQPAYSAPPPAPTTHGAGTEPEPSSNFNVRDFDIFCKEHRLEWYDYRNNGGYLTVSTKRQGDQVAAQLAAWGFRFKETLGWYLS